MITPVLIAKYFEGSCSKKEIEEVESWVNSSSANQKTFQRLKTIWEETGKVRPESEVQETEAAWQKIKTKIKVTPKAAPKWKTLSFILPRAAAAVLVFTTMIIFYLTQTNQGNQVVKMIEISTQKGEKRQLALADGSTIWLNAESTVKYPENFKGETREIYLDGEAYFKVSHNPSKPFKVNTADITTTVLGTEFNVQAYPEQRNIFVALDQGKVAVSHNDNKMLLEPGKLVSYNKTTHQFSKQSILGNHNQWRNNVLELNNISLEKAIPVIERWFNEKIVVDNNKLNTCLVTANFKDPKIDEVLEIITSILSIESEKVNGVYHIKGNNCN